MFYHISVMTPEVIELLNCKPGKIYVDCTLGGSGHARAICERIIPGGLLIGIDQDIDAVNNATKVLKQFESNICLYHENYINLPIILSQRNLKGVDGILIDLGLSLHQLKSSGRGFSFGKDEPLDMRMDIRSTQTAYDFINRMDAKNLCSIFREFGEERCAWQITRRIIEARKACPIKSSKQLADIVCAAVPVKMSYKKKIHPATRVFMALRIAVNKEIERIEAFMENVADLLNPKGRLCVISFHSLEDRVVKHSIKTMEKECTCPPKFPKCVCGKKKVMRSLTRKVLRPGDEEVAHNPMARSARLRAAEKI